MCWNALFLNLFWGSKVTVNKCPASNVTAPEHNNQFGVYKKFIFCKVTVNKQQHRYIGIHKKAIIIRVVNGLAFSMVTVFEDFSHKKYKKVPNSAPFFLFPPFYT